MPRHWRNIINKRKLQYNNMDVLGGHDANETSQAGDIVWTPISLVRNPKRSLIDEKNRMVSAQSLGEGSTEELAIRKFLKTVYS